MLKDIFLGLIENYSEDDAYNLECWNEINLMHSTKNRFYHNLTHLECMLIELEAVKEEIKDIDLLKFTIFYHDIVYDGSKVENEHKSALLFEKRISSTSFSRIEECKSIIEATKEHKTSPINDVNLILDIDLSILGKKQDVYIDYCKNVRKEYKMYSDEIFRDGRIKVLKSMLDMESIYKTDYFKSKYENMAVLNLTNELKLLNENQL